MKFESKFLQSEWSLVFFHTFFFVNRDNKLSYRKKIMSQQNLSTFYLERTTPKKQSPANNILIKH